MTREEIERMEAGRELDALIAEKVMEWEIHPHQTHYINRNDGDTRFIICGEFMPSTDIGAAWQVVEKMAELCKHGPYEPEFIEVICYGDKTAYCGKIWAHHDGDIPIIDASGNTVPLAVCRAALLAVEVHP